MNVAIKLGPKATLPKKAHLTDAGFDLIAVSMEGTRQGYTEYDTQVHIAIPKNHVGLVFPRSSISDTRMSLTNSVGVIDSGYSGSIKFRFKAANSGIGIYKIGDKIGQLIIVPIPNIELNQVEELPSSERGENGFGASGKSEPILATPNPREVERNP